MFDRILYSLFYTDMSSTISLSEDIYIRIQIFCVAYSGFRTNTGTAPDAENSPFVDVTARKVSPQHAICLNSISAPDTQLICGAERTFNKDAVAATDADDKVASRRHPIASLLQIKGHVTPRFIVFPAGRQMAR